MDLSYSILGIGVGISAFRDLDSRKVRSQGPAGRARKSKQLITRSTRSDRTLEGTNEEDRSQIKRVSDVRRNSKNRESKDRYLRNRYLELAPPETGLDGGKIRMSFLCCKGCTLRGGIPLRMRLVSACLNPLRHARWSVMKHNSLIGSPLYSRPSYGRGLLSLCSAARKGIDLLKLGILFAWASLILSFQSFYSLIRNGEGSLGGKERR